MAASTPTEVRVATALAVVGAWNIAVPYLAHVLDLEVGVRPVVEVVDHVLPGVIVVAGAAYLAAVARRRAWASSPVAIVAAGLAFLGGFWVLATHLPLLVDAAGGTQRWSAAVWHSVAGVLMVGLALWCVLRSVPAARER